MAVTKVNKTPTAPAKSSNRKKGGKDKTWKKGPHLPNAIKKELETLNGNNSSDEDIQSDDNIDLYEYEEDIADEELKKNRRYDPVDNFEYQLPKDFEDEDVASDDDGEGSGKGDSDDDDDNDDDDGKHSRMLQDITGLPEEAFDGKKKNNDVVVYEAYPESEYNPSRDVLDGDGRITIDDLLAPLHGNPGFSKIRKDLQRMNKKSMSILPPLPKSQQQKVDRISTYAYSKEKLSEFNAVVKKNREAPTIFFNENIDVGYSTVGAIASEFRPRTEFEKKMDSLINSKELSDAHKGDGARLLLELNKVSVEDVKGRADRLAKMRNLLFRHEMKSKRIKKIKSKTFRRVKKKDRLKAGANDIEMDPEAAKELAQKQEFKRAQERMTLKHKNTSKWAKRIKKRGFDIQDDGTRAAISEQLQQHALLTRKRNSMHDDDDDSSDDSMEEEDEDISGGEDDASKVKFLEKGKKRTLEVLEEEEDMPKSGLLSLPFMVRGQKKKKEAADQEARLALEEFDSSIKQLEGDDDFKDNKGSLGGRKVFGAQKKQVSKSKKKVKDTDNYFDNTDSEDDGDTLEDVDDKQGRMNYTQKDVTIDTNILREESEVGHDSLLKSFDDIAKDSGPKIEYEVSLCPTNSSNKKRKTKDSNQVKSEKKTETKKSEVAELAPNKATDIEVGNDESDSDGETRMVDGIITSGTEYELPSQDDLIRRAFAGDDVEEDFELAKQEIMNEENPEPEKPVILPGWGQWTRVQKKRGLPSWLLAEHERAKKKRDEDLKRRPDAHLRHVIISEKVDKKAEKLQTNVLPFPFKDKEHFERSNRMPLGPEFNPATAIGELNRPDVVKKAGVKIKPIKLKSRE